MTRFLDKSFTVPMAGDQDYRDRWEATFGKRSEGAKSGRPEGCNDCSHRTQPLGNERVRCLDCGAYVSARCVMCAAVCGPCGEDDCPDKEAPNTRAFAIAWSEAGQHGLPEDGIFAGAPLPTSSHAPDCQAGPCGEDDCPDKETPNACASCDGSGQIRGHWGVVRCTFCKAANSYMPVASPPSVAEDGCVVMFPCIKKKKHDGPCVPSGPDHAADTPSVAQWSAEADYQRGYDAGYLAAIESGTCCMDKEKPQQ